MINSLSLTSKEQENGCQMCAFSSTCFPSAFGGVSADEIRSIISPEEKFYSKQITHEQGQAFHSLYVIKSGAVKTYINTVEGKERITAFYLPGDIVGLESIAGGIHLNSASIISDSRICKIDYANLAILRKENATLSDWAINVFSLSLAADHEFFQCLSLITASSKLATFLLNISKRSSRSEEHQLVFKLPMSRLEIGNYLGIAAETASRAFSKLADKKCIEKSSRQINIIDLAKLKEYANASRAR